MMLKVEAIIWRTALDSLEIELERKLQNANDRVFFWEFGRLSGASYERGIS